MYYPYTKTTFASEQLILSVIATITATIPPGETTFLCQPPPPTSPTPQHPFPPPPGPGRYYYHHHSPPLPITSNTTTTKNSHLELSLNARQPIRGSWLHDLLVVGEKRCAWNFDPSQGKGLQEDMVDEYVLFLHREIHVK